ncbi:MAG: alkaline phosphatase, partial [Muribaculaceae bacterium]|nr:alkaline phosphatase [Muribaculaceae bacterium]
LEFLEKKTPNRFFMMVEGGNIDHALHGNDGGSAIIEIFNFNEALKIAYDFYLAHPDETLIVVTADHDTGGMTVGNAANGYKVFFNYLQAQKVSKEMFSDYCKGILKSRRIYTWD